MSTRRLIFLVLALVAGVFCTVRWYLESERVALPWEPPAQATEPPPAGPLESGQADARSWRPPRLRPLTRSRRPTFLDSGSARTEPQAEALAGRLPLSVFEHL